MHGQDNEKRTHYEVRLSIDNKISLDPIDPIPIQYGGNSLYLVSGKKYLPFIGRNDNLPNLLLEARLTSTSQNACISAIAESTIGKGLAFIENSSPDKDLLKWMKCVNNQQQSFDDAMNMTVDGERQNGNQFIEIVKGQVGKKKYLKIYPHSFLRTRLAEPGTRGYPEEVLISDSFTKNGFRIPKDPVRIPLWSPTVLDKRKCWKNNNDGSFSTMLHFKNEVSGIEHYGMPASISGLRYQVLEGKYAQFNIDNLDNNMILGGMLIFKSAMTREEAEENARQILLTHIGAGKTGRIAVLSSENGAQDVHFIPYNTSKEGSYLESDKHNEGKIWKANRCTGLMTIITGTGLGTGGDHIRSIWDTVEATLLQPLRSKLIHKVVTPIFKIYSEWHEVKEIADYKFEFQSAMPFSFMGDIKPETFMKVKEARQLARLEPDEVNGEKYLSQMKAKNEKDVPTEPSSKKGANNNG